MNRLELFNTIESYTGSSSFMLSLSQQLKSRGSLSEKQLDAAERFFAPVEPVTMDDRTQAVADFLAANHAGNEFLTSLHNQLQDRGALSDKQLAAVERNMGKGGEQLDAAVLLGLFATASANGLKRPALTFNDVRISKAPDHGNNAGHLYVKLDGEYEGKITPDGRYMAVRSAAPETAALLADICKDPMAKFTNHGHESGQCCCCGRELTNPESIELGIGPVCRTKWFG